MCSVKDYPPFVLVLHLYSLLWKMDVWEAGERARGVELVPCEHQGLSLIPRTVVEQPGLPCVLGIPGLRKQRLAD